jgi:hypothetical protein
LSVEDQVAAAEALALLLAPVSGTLRPESLWALKQAALAAETDGIGGVLILKIPRRENGQVDVQFTTGQAQIQLEF